MTTMTDTQTTSHITPEMVDVNNNFIGSGDLNISVQKVNIKRNVKISGDLFIDGDLTVSGSLQVVGKLHCNGSVTAQGISVGGDITVYGNLTSSGRLTAGGSITCHEFIKADDRIKSGRSIWAKHNVHSREDISAEMSIISKLGAIVSYYGNVTGKTSISAHGGVVAKKRITTLGTLMSGKGIKAGSISAGAISASAEIWCATLHGHIAQGELIINNSLLPGEDWMNPIELLITHKLQDSYWGRKIISAHDRGGLPGRRLPGGTTNQFNPRAHQLF